MGRTPNYMVPSSGQRVGPVGQDGLVAGAGAILWKFKGETGNMVMMRRAVIGLPGEAHAQVAEAYGCRAGLRMLLDIRCEVRAARVAGDNLNVVRYCASEGRIRKPLVQELLEGPLGD